MLKKFLFITFVLIVLSACSINNNEIKKSSITSAQNSINLNTEISNYEEEKTIQVTKTNNNIKISNTTKPEIKITNSASNDNTKKANEPTSNTKNINNEIVESNNNSDKYNDLMDEVEIYLKPKNLKLVERKENMIIFTSNINMLTLGDELATKENQKYLKENLGTIFWARSVRNQTYEIVFNTKYNFDCVIKIEDIETGGSKLIANFREPMK